MCVCVCVCVCEWYSYAPALAPLINVRSGADGDKSTPHVSCVCVCVYHTVRALVYRTPEHTGGRPTPALPQR